MMRNFSILLIVICFCCGISGCCSYGMNTASEPSACFYLNLKSMQIEKRCNEWKKNKIVSVQVSVYDSGFSQKSSPLFYLHKDEIVFPFSLDSIIKDRSGAKAYSIAMFYHNAGIGYSLHIEGADWKKDSLPFTYFH